MNAGEVDFACNDYFMTDAQLRAAGLNGNVLQIPLVLVAVVPAYNLPQVDGRLRFSGSVLADIYLGDIRKWNDPRLKLLNPGVPLPDQDMAVIRGYDGLGASYIWADYLANVSADWKAKVGVSTSVNWPVGLTAKGGEGITGLVKNTPGSIAYVELLLAVQNNLTYGEVENQEGEFVNANLESMKAAARASFNEIGNDLNISVTNAPGKGSYPVCGAVWAIVRTKYPDHKGKRVRDFLKWAIDDGQEFVEELYYSRLPHPLVVRLREKLDQIE
jgi:phosphate transport system substrate-binding protein